MNIQPYKSFDDFKHFESQLPAPKSYNELKKSSSRQFLYITKTFGEADTVKIVRDALVEMCSFLNYETATIMIDRAAEEIVKKYPLCRLADIKMFESFILTGGGEKRFRIDTRELLQMFDEYNAYKEDQFEQINYEEKKARDHASKVQEDQDYFDFVAKWGERLRRDWQASDKSMGFDDFCKMKYRPIDNPNPSKPTTPTFGTKKFNDMPVRDLCAKNGVDYEERLKRETPKWIKQFHKYGWSEQMHVEDFIRYKKTSFDNELRSELEKL